MYTNRNFRFKTTISKENYESKQDVTACLSTPGARAIGREKIAWHEWEVSVGEFLDFATNGYCFCNLFDIDPNKQYWVQSKEGKFSKTYPVYRKGSNSGYMKMQFKADKYFRGTQTIFVDVDYTRFDNVEEYLGTLRIPPTCVYMSFSDKKEKGKDKVCSRRFRLVYVFSEVLDKKAFLHISRTINSYIEADTGEKMEDDCGTRMSQYMNGVFGNDETYRSDIIYSKDDFYEGGLFCVVPVVDDVAATDEEVESAPDFDERFVCNMQNMDYQTFMHYYSRRVRYFYRVEYEEWIGNEDYQWQFTNDNYLQLYYYREKVLDGQHRRRKLFYSACLRRLMYPEVDANTLLFNLYVDRDRFYDNSDGVITITHLKRKVLKVLQMSMEELANYCGSTIAYWKANRPRIIFKSGIKFNLGLVRTVYKEIRYAEIDEQYDPQMSLRENMEAGLDVPQSTLYRYCKERGYPTDPNRPQSIRKQQEEKRRIKQQGIRLFTILYDTRLTPKKNLEQMAAHGLSLSYATLMRWRERYIAPVFEPVEPVYCEPIEPVETPKVGFSLNLNFDIFQTRPQETIGDAEIETIEAEREKFENSNWPTFWQTSFLNNPWPNLS